MYEMQKDGTRIDMKAAGINLDAAEIGGMAEERRRSAEASLTMRKLLEQSWDDDARQRRCIEIADAIAQDVNVIRDAAQRIQDRAQEMRSLTDSPEHAEA
ncbi:MAG TPA: hypothetical protein VMF89_32020 [Polyangiales bacterium]|nr:hypothetical protein [Polyangiales bacterium]